MPEIFTVRIAGKTCPAERGTLLSSLLPIAQPCSGRGQCGKCKVRASGALSPLGDEERKHLTEAEIASGIRLACQTTVAGDCQVDVLSSGTIEVLQDGTSAVRCGEKAFSSLAVAIDVGTTTVAARLIGKNGETLATHGVANPQSVFGADVISRVGRALAGDARALADVLLKALDETIVSLAADAKRDPQEIDALAVTGNTAMLCLLSGVSPEPLSHAPFALPDRFGRTVRAGTLGLRSVDKGTEVYFPPCISAFVGADTVTALLAAGFDAPNITALLADVGTNGEMALWHGGTLRVCSTAAGPAFEGVGISMGTCGMPGAIDRVRIENGSPVVHVIGEGTAQGICGSGLCDAIAVLLDLGKIDESGYLEDDAFLCETVKITPRDVRAVQLAKSAIRAGIDTLLYRAGCDIEDVSAFALAGAFGRYLDRGSAVRIGLLSKVLASRAEAIGNAALDGCVLLLCDRRLRAVADGIALRAETVDLSTDAYFMNDYVERMTFDEP